MNKVKRKRLLNRLLVTVTCTCMLSACWDQRPIEDLALIEAIGMEVNQADPDQIDFSFRYPIYEGDKREAEKYDLITANNLGEALILWQRQNALSVAGGKVRLLVLCETIARQGLLGFSDYILSPMADNNAFVVVCDSTTALLNVQLPETERLVNYIHQMVHTAQLEGETLRVTAGTLATQINALGFDAVVPRLQLLDEERVKLDGAVLFRDMDMVGTISPEEMLLLVSLKGGRTDVPMEGIVIDELDDPNITIELLSPKFRIKPAMVDGQLQVKFDYEAAYVLRSYRSNRDITELEAARNLTKHIEAYLRQEMQGLIAKFQELEVDPLGVGKRFRAINPKEFEAGQFRESWAEAQIELNVRLRMLRSGALLKTEPTGR